VVINNDTTPQTTTLTLGDGVTTQAVSLDAHGIEILDLVQPLPGGAPPGHAQH
jgi:hypothetical protein